MSGTLNAHFRVRKPGSVLKRKAEEEAPSPPSKRTRKASKKKEVVLITIPPPTETTSRVLAPVSRLVEEASTRKDTGETAESLYAPSDATLSLEGRMEASIAAITVVQPETVEAPLVEDHDLSQPDQSASPHATSVTAATIPMPDPREAPTDMSPRRARAVAQAQARVAAATRPVRSARPQQEAPRSVQLPVMTDRKLRNEALEPGFPLAPNYKLLQIKFEALEQVLRRRRDRHLPFLLERHSMEVEQLCKRRFQREDLARMVHLFPDAYELAIKKDEGAPCLRVAVGAAGTIDIYGVEAKGASFWENRRTSFHEALMRLMHQEHMAHQVRHNCIPYKFWCEDFELANVPDAPQATLPAPEAVVVRPEEILERVAAERLQASNRVRQALAKNSQTLLPSNEHVAAAQAAVTEQRRPAPKALSGLSRLLAAVREKEANNKLVTVAHSADAGKLRRMQDNLAQIAAALRSMFFTTEVLPEDDVISNLLSTRKSRDFVGPEEIRRQLDELLRLPLTPPLAVRKTVGTETFIAVDLKVSHSEVETALRKHIA